ncbi:MAG: type II secretion system secretin GspD [Nitrospiraceae bacterium]|nr:type II secretion system secretin GspD [Nitrospiraceae bacterium]
MQRKAAIAALLLLLLCTRAWAAKRITLNFVNVDLATFTKFVSETTGRNFVFDQRLKGKVTVITPTGLGKEQTFKLFTSVLNLKGFTLQPVGVNLYKIIPVSEARQAGLPAMNSQINENYMVRLIALKYISAVDAVRFLSPVVSRDGYIASFDQGNYLLVIDAALNIEKIMRILDVIDTAPTAEQSQIVFLKNASATDVARILNEGLPRKGPAQPPHAIADARLNAVILMGDQPDKEAMKRLIGMLDVPGKLVLSGIHVYFLEHAKAKDLAKTLTGLIGKQAAGRPEPTIAAAPQKMNIMADEDTNALVIAASQSDYQNILPVIKQLDRARSQVFVQAMIVEASLNDLLSLGATWRATATKGGQPLFIGGVGTIDSTAVQNIISGLSGLSMGGLGNILNIPVTTTVNGVIQTQTLTLPGFAALFSTNQFRDAVHVLSTPQIYTSDNQPAEIVVGENVPFITGRETAGTTGVSTGLIASTIERKDVGIKLKITPHITEGDVVRLDIYQEISAVEQPTETGANAVAILTQVGPTTTMRSTKTSVFVNDGQTIVIGGLMSEHDENTVTKVPLLGDIPILGYLFKTRSVSREKTNLLVFISPTVIKTPSDIGRLTMEKARLFGQRTSTYVKGELIVKFREGTTDEQARQVLGRKGIQVLNLMEADTYLVKLPEGREVMETAKVLAKIPEVLYALPNYSATPSGQDE